MENDLQTWVVNNLREIMNDKHITQGEIADAMQTTRQTIANYLTSRTELTLNNFEKMAAIIGVDVAQLFTSYNKSGNFNAAANVAGNRNKTTVTGRDYIQYDHAAPASVETEIKYLKQLIADKDEQIKFLKSLITK